MSRIYFRSPEGEAELRGSERAYAGVLCNDLMYVALDLDNSHYLPEWEQQMWSNVIPADHWAYKNGKLDGGGVRLYVSGRSESTLPMDGEQIDTFSMSLNTALVAGSDAVKLLARLHGQCEIHCWVDGPNRAWLAGIIERGRKTHVLRPNQGWENVVELLRSRDDSPVVTSYSVCEGFPRPDLDLDYWPEGDEDSDDERYDKREKWWEFPAARQWEGCMKTLREHGGRLELRPDDWEDYHFRHGVNAFEYRAYLEQFRDPNLY
jgi:hypothetical protein